MLKFNIQSIIINSGKTKGLFSTFHRFQIKCVVLTNITPSPSRTNRYQRLGSSFNCNVLAWSQSAGTKIIRFNLLIKFQPPSHLQTNKCVMMTTWSSRLSWYSEWDSVSGIVEAYMARTDNTWDQYVNKVKGLIGDFANKRKQVLVQTYNRENSSGGTGLFGG